MNTTVISRLEDIKVKFAELNEEIAKPEVIQDAILYRRLTKHHADLRQVIEAYQSLQAVDREIAGAKDLLNESDPEMQAMAKKELAKSAPVDIHLYAGIGPGTRPLSFPAPLPAHPNDGSSK